MVILMNKSLQIKSSISYLYISRYKGNRGKLNLEYLYNRIALDTGHIVINRQDTLPKLIRDWFNFFFFSEDWFANGDVANTGNVFDGMKLLVLVWKCLQLLAIAWLCIENNVCKSFGNKISRNMKKFGASGTHLYSRS